MGWLQFVYWKPLWDSSRIHNNAMRNRAGVRVCGASGVDFMIFLLFVCLCSRLGWVSVAWPLSCLFPQPRLSRAKWSFHFLLDSSALRAEHWAPWPSHCMWSSQLTLHQAEPLSKCTSCLSATFVRLPRAKAAALTQIPLSLPPIISVHQIQGLKWDFGGEGNLKSGVNWITLQILNQANIISILF